MNLVRESMIQTAGVLNRRQRDELPVRPLQWHYQNANPFDDTRIVAKGPTHLYVILDDVNGKYLVKKTRLADNHTDHCGGFTCIDSAREFVNEHYEDNMAPWVYSIDEINGGSKDVR